MNDLKAFYDDFSRAVISPTAGASPKEFSANKPHRFAIYRNNVHRGLCDALAAAYPTVEKLVGQEFFHALAQQFVVSETSRPGSLALYGAGFAKFVAEHEALASLGYLADVARLERARLESLNAQDADPLSAHHLAGCEEGLGAMRMQAHPACRMVMSDHPVLSIWNAQNVPGSSTNIIQQAENVLITRPYMDVKLQFLTHGQAAFCAALFNDASDIETACAHAVSVDGVFDVTRSFADLLVCGAFDARPFIEQGFGHG
jgi:hypothetical protein